MFKRFLMASVALALAACGSTAGGAEGTPQPAPSKPTGDLTVLAAASLTGAFNKIQVAFQAANPGVAIHFSYGGSSTLAAQVIQGAPADVFASADMTNMQKVVDAGDAVGTPQVFARNSLQIVVPAGNPKNVHSLADLAAPGLTVVLCAPAVPCGNYASQALNKAGVKLTPKSQEQDVKAVVSKVSLGEADAGIVYTTDVLAGGATVTGVDIPAGQNVVATYPLVQLQAATNVDAAQAFIGFVTGTAGQAILKAYGFGPAS